MAGPNDLSGGAQLTGGDIKLWIMPGVLELFALPFAWISVQMLHDKEPWPAIAEYAITGTFLCIAGIVWAVFRSRIADWFRSHKRLADTLAENADLKYQLALRSHEQSHSLEPTYTVSFGYLPLSPLERGWTRAYKPETVVEFGADPTILGSLRMEPKGELAIDHLIPPYAQFSDRLLFTAKISPSTMIFTRLEVTTKDGSSGRKPVWIKFYRDRMARASRTVGNWHDPAMALPEQTVWLPFKSLENGVIEYDIDFHAAVELAFGSQGWIYNAVLAVRLRGNLSISPMAFSRANSVRRPNDTSSEVVQKNSLSELLAPLQIEALTIARDLREYRASLPPFPSDPQQHPGEEDYDYITRVNTSEQLQRIFQERREQQQKWRARVIHTYANRGFGPRITAFLHRFAEQYEDAPIGRADYAENFGTPTDETIPKIAQQIEMLAVWINRKERGETNLLK